MKPLKIQSNTMEKQGLLMRDACGKVRKHCKPLKPLEMKYYGKTMFINAGMLAEKLESIEHF